MKKRIIYGLLIALLIVVICICGDKVIKKPEAVIASSELQEANKKESEEIIEPVAEVEEIEEEPLYYGLTYDVLDDEVVLEVKFNEMLPNHIASVIMNIPSVRQAISKYALCFEKKEI